MIQQQGDAGLVIRCEILQEPSDPQLQASGTPAIEHSGEHYGQLVVYYRANGLVPPDSRR